MRFTVLGCSGGVGSGQRTTSFLLDDDVLIDAGTGVLDLSLEAMARIDHVFVSHSHLDHVCAIPLMADSVGSLRRAPLVIHARPETVQALQQHMFNNLIWPDFARLPSGKAPFIRYQELVPGGTVELAGRRIRSIPADHVVSATGFLVEGPNASLAFSGDTCVNDALWQELNEASKLRYLLIETAFSNKDESLALAAKHLSPRLLAGELRKFTGEAEVFITHLKPTDMAVTMQEIAREVTARRPQMLAPGMVFEL